MGEAKASRPCILIGGVAVTCLAIALVAWNYWVEAWETVYHSADDLRCFDNLKEVYRRALRYRKAAAEWPPSLAALWPCEVVPRCPTGVEYRWFGGRPLAEYREVLVRCPGHRESPAGWDLRRDTASLLLLSDGSVVLVSDQDLPREARPENVGTTDGGKGR